MKICIVAPAKSGSTAIYNTVRTALSREGYCYSFFEPQRPYPILRLKNYDFAEPFVTKIMVSRMVSEKSDFHMDWFDKRILLVRDVKDLMISELLFRPLIAPAEISAEAIAEFVALIKDKERNPQGRSVIELHKRADALGVSSLNWEIYRTILCRLQVLRARHACAVVHFEDYARGDYSAFRQILSMPIGPTNLDGTWVSHIQRKGQSGEWRKWFTPEDLEFATGFFGEYNAAFGYETARNHSFNAEPLDPQFGSTHVEKKFTLRRKQMDMLNNADAQVETAEELEVLISRARDGGIQQIQKLVQLQAAGNLPKDLISRAEVSALKFFSEVVS